jgi:phosphatidylserine decarboxylase
MESLLKFIPPIHRQGYVFIAIFAGLALFSAIYSTFIGWVMFILTAWCVYFFRNPDRVVPVGSEFLVSPADGVVQKIEVCATPEELGMGDELRTRISIFLNVFNVHVNRVPASGVIKRLNYRPGKFFNASLDKASIYNERQSVLMTLEDGRDVVFIQIAGLIAKRIVCELDEGQLVQAGERFGLIRFGSRMDVYLPQGVNPLVVPGQTMVGGETILANLVSNEETRAGEVR